jgi:hypothetical protein
VWGVLGAALRFIPYVGPVAAAGAPILISLAALPGWAGPLSVVALFAVLELFTNLVLETVLLAGAAGVSQVALVVSLAFWTWLWGPLGLLMATPLTVCLVVFGKHVPGLRFVGLLLADTPSLAPEFVFYQRLLARDQSEAADLIDAHVATGPPRSVYDALLLPALNYAERDRLEQRLTPEEELAVVEATRELSSDAAEAIRRLHRAETRTADGAASAPLPAPHETLRVLGYAANGVADEVALTMLAHLLDDLPIAVDIVSTRMQAAALVSLVREQAYSVVCLADLPPSPLSKTRYFVKRLRTALPHVRILVGRWGPPALADDGTHVLREAGANLAASTLMESRMFLGGLAERRAIPAAPVAPAYSEWT